MQMNHWMTPEMRKSSQHEIKLDYDCVNFKIIPITTCDSYFCFKLMFDQILCQFKISPDENIHVIKIKSD